MTLEKAFEKLHATGRIDVRRCSICEELIGFILHPNGGSIGFDASCGCASGDIRLVTFQEFIKTVTSMEQANASE